MARRLALDPLAILSLVFPARPFMEDLVIHLRFTLSYAVCFPRRTKEPSVRLRNQGTGRRAWISAIAFQGCATGLRSMVMDSPMTNFPLSPTPIVPRGMRGSIFPAF